MRVLCVFANFPLLSVEIRECSASLLNNVNLGSPIQLISSLKSLKHKWYPESESNNESFEGRILIFTSFAFQKGASLLIPVTGFL